MAGTISPVGDGAKRRRLLIGHGVGLLLGAATMATALTLAAQLMRVPLQAVSPWLAPVLAVVLLGWASQSALGKGLPYPLPRWQVPEDWRRTLPRMVTISVYGYLLGLGFLTNMVVPTYWVLLGASVWTGGLAPLLIAWALYAGVRFATTWRATEAAARACTYTAGYVPRGAIGIRYAAAALLALAAAGLVL